MFGNNKPFGTASAFGASSFGSTTTPFGQSTNTFGAKPATSNVFGTSAFGTAAPNTGGLFGASTPTTGTGLFGQQSTAFGAPASTNTGSFGFGATSTTGSFFGNATPSTQTTGGLFGSSGTSAFGAPRPTFGGFGNTNTGTSLFGQNTSTGTGIFGTGGFSAPSTLQVGTMVKFNPPTGTDTMLKSGVTTNISTRHQCITCMKEYENKSLEELRLEDYTANRKGAPAGGITGFGNPTQQTSLFGTPAAASTSGFSFGNTTQAKPLFGNTGTTNVFGSGGGLFGQTSQAQTGGLFGKPAGTSTTPAFNFGNTPNTSLFGQNNQQKPLFGQPATGTGLFGSTATTQATGFGGFGANPTSTGLFGAKSTGFASTNTATTNTFSFVNTNNMNSGGLFGQKPAGSAFGTTTPFGTQSTSFGTFGATQPVSTGLFGQQKPATSAFGNTGSTFGGLGTTFGAAPFSMGLGSNAATANKSTFSFGGTGNTGFSFGGQNPSSTGFNFAPPSLFSAGNDPNALALYQQAQQQIFAMTLNPYGDSPLFRSALKDSSRQEVRPAYLEPTNPSAQKALLTNNRHKVSPIPTTKLQPKSRTPVPNGKVSLFDGLEDEEPSLDATFVPKRSVKKLVLKHHSNRSSFMLTSNLSSSATMPTQINLSISLQKSPEHGGSTSPPPQPLTVDISNSSLRINHEKLPPPMREKSLVDIRKPPKSIEFPKPNVNLNTDLDETISALHSNKQKPAKNIFSTSTESDDTFTDIDSSLSESVTVPDTLSQGGGGGGENVQHPTRIRLKRPGYYTIPKLDELIALVDENGNCYVKDFTVGCEGYGKVTFPGMTNVVGLNLDEIIHFRKKEITVYPDDSNKPPIGEGLNRKAEVTLEGVWPIDKTSHVPIKDPERLSMLNYRQKIMKSTERLGATFIDYRPETGSWIFHVHHFSKYGLEDSDDEVEVPTLPDKMKATAPMKQARVQVNTASASAETFPKEPLIQKPILPSFTEDEEMEGIASQSQLHKDQDLLGDSILSPTDNFYSPTRQLMAASLDAGRIQGMKASFFQDEMDDSWDGFLTSKGAGDAPIFHKKHLDLDKQIPLQGTSPVHGNDFAKRQKHAGYGKEVLYPDLLSIPLHAGGNAGIQHSMSSLSISTSGIPDLSSYPIMHTSSQVPLAMPKPPEVVGKIYLKPLACSTLHNKQHLLADAGYFMGRRFRVGWGPGLTLMCLQPPEEPTKARKSATKLSLFSDVPGMAFTPRQSGFTVSIMKIENKSFTKAKVKVQKNMEEVLELQIAHSLSAVEDGAPLFTPKIGVELVHKLQTLFENHLKDAGALKSDHYIRQCVCVWGLLVALWGDIPGVDKEKGYTDYEYQIARREALSKWLIHSNEEIISREMNDTLHKNYLTTIFHSLNGRKISDAVHLAQRHGDFKLSLLLSQTESTPIIRSLISKQLFNWEENGMYLYIEHQRLILYTLLSGMMMWTNIYDVVNCCENLDWKRALAMHMWYHCSSCSSVQQGVEFYDNAFHGTEKNPKYCNPPYPPYLESILKDSGEILLDENLDKHPFDICYHILKLFCDRTHDIGLLFIPNTYSSDSLDFRLAWLLYVSMSSLRCNIPPNMTCRLNMDFATQLENIGMWHWAVFAILHIPDVSWRIKHVKDILLKYVSIEENDDESHEKEAFLCEKLLIPEKWIFEAKAIRAGLCFKYADEAWYWLKAGFWTRSHNIVVRYLASEAIINEDYDYLLKYLVELSVPERCSTILDWPIGGQVYLNYINACRMVKDILREEVSAYDLEKITPEVVSLCNRLSRVPIHTLKDRLCISEMAKKTATILRTIFTLHAEHTNTTLSVSTLVPYFKQLPLPQDYAIEEGRLIAHNFLVETTQEI